MSSPTFKFTDEDIAKYASADPKWGPVGIPTYKRTYSRKLPLSDGQARREEWLDTCIRVVEGSMNLGLEVNDPTATVEWAKEALEYIFYMGMEPPGRGYWMMGTEYSTKRGGDALNNCWWVSVRPQSYENMEMHENTWMLSHPTKEMPSYPFVFMFDRAMLGGGVGFGVNKKNLKKYKAISNFVDLKIVLDPSHPDWERIKSSEEWSTLPEVQQSLVTEAPEGYLTYNPTTDDREGWGVTVRELIDAHWNRSLYGTKSSSKTLRLCFNLSDIREYGRDINGFGGTASGPLPLIAAMTSINKVLNQRVDKRLRSVDGLDIMNLLGRCVVAGNVRRTALISLGDPDDKDYIDAKNYTLYQDIIDTSYGNWGWYKNEWGRDTQKLKDKEVCISERFAELTKDIDLNSDKGKQDAKYAFEHAKAEVEHKFDHFWKMDNHRWSSNNSVYTSEMFTDFHFITAGIIANGEPGVGNEWLMKNFGRIKDGFQEAIDADAEGVNPCAEITLANGEPCNLVEFVPYRCSMFGFDFKRVLTIATQYVFRITFAKYMWPATRRIIEKNRRIGVSLTGMQDYFLYKYGNYAVLGFEHDPITGETDITKPIFDHRITDELEQWYTWVIEINVNHATLLGVKPSIKRTTVKPSGTVAKLPGVSSGIHWHYSAYLIQRIRYHESDPNLQVMKMCGLPIEKDAKAPNTMVVEFPVKNPNADHPAFLSAGDIPLEVQFANQFLFAYYWADNAVSATLTFKQDETDKIEPLLKAYSNRIKTTSLLPYSGHGYVQAPWEPITEEEYNRRISQMIDKPENVYRYMKIADMVDLGADSDCAGGACPSK